MHFIISTLKLCVTIEKEYYFDPLFDVINCISFDNPEALCLYPIESRIIGRHSCSINFKQIPIRKDLLDMECVRLKATPQTWAFIKLSHSQFFILILIIIFFINQIFQVVQVGKKLNVSLAINVFLLTMAEHYVRGRGVVLHAFISIIYTTWEVGREGEREKVWRQAQAFR